MSANLLRQEYNSSILAQVSISEFFRSSGGFCSSWSDQPPHPTRGNRGLLCSHAKQTSEIVPARPPTTIQASPESAIIRFLASPIPQGIKIVHGQSFK